MTEYVKIKNIEKLETNYDLYDIETKNHNFYANDVLVHNSNGAVCFNTLDGLWVQSRENIITPEKDNAGCAWFVEQNREHWLKILEDLCYDYSINTDTHTISVYFEWCGGNIQKNSAVSGLDKRAIIFEHFKVSPIDSESGESAKWHKTFIVSDELEYEDMLLKWVSSNEHGIFNIMDFPRYEIVIDFNKHEYSQNELIKLVEETIEPNSPVGRNFGIDGNIGEGIVCSYLTPDKALIQFKVKGEKHSKSKVKTLAPVDTEKLERIDQCVEKITHNWRFEQGLTEVFGLDYQNTIDIKQIGAYLKWVASDTLKEESDIIAEFGFEPKDVMGKVQAMAKKYFMEIYNG